MRKHALVVRARWDDAAAVWVAQSDDIPGLITEAADMSSLMVRVKVIAADLLADDEALRVTFPAEFPIVLLAEQVEQLKLSAA